MGHTVDLNEERANRKPYASGQARCLACQHEWVAVVPLGVYWFECPKCSLMRGRYLYAFNFADQRHWTCGCGNDLFHMLKDGCYCPNCGQVQAGF